MSVEEVNDNRGRGALRVERAIVELRRGRMIAIADEEGVSAVSVVETLDPRELAKFAGPDDLICLTLTAERAHALGLGAHATAVEIKLPASATPSDLAALAGMNADLDVRRLRARSVGGANPRAAAGCRLARHGRLMPAVLCSDGLASLAGSEHLEVTVGDVEDYPAARRSELMRMSQARVPLNAEDQCEIIVYRERFADAEHVAVVIGNPDRAMPVLVRLHSACLTGDLLGSLRCDCGDQLRQAASRIAASGGGIVLYLDHEGRGIGLINKLRAYALQDTGLDTLEANLHLGFQSDERDYGIACEMLKDLSVERIRLLTNNPEKIAALENCGIEIVGRVSLPIRVNRHNARYLRTKRECAGHTDSEPEGSITE